MNSSLFMGLLHTMTDSVRKILKNSISNILIFKYYKNGSLSSLLQEEQSNNSFQNFDDTKRMIIIYGMKSDNMFKSLKEFYARKRPPLVGIPQSYINLISKCWEEDPTNRLSFSEIVNLMKTDSGFIIDGADKNAYYEYIKLLDDYIDLLDEDQDRLISFI